MQNHLETTRGSACSNILRLSKAFRCATSGSETIVWLYGTASPRPRICEGRATSPRQALFTEFVKQELMCSVFAELGFAQRVARLGDAAPAEWHDTFATYDHLVLGVALVRAVRTVRPTDILPPAELAAHDYWKLTKFGKAPVF